MSLCKEKIEHGKIQGLFKRPRNSKLHKYMKRCINKLVRIQAKNISLDDDKNLTPKKPYKFWEY